MTAGCKQFDHSVVLFIALVLDFPKVFISASKEASTKAVSCIGISENLF